MLPNPHYSNTISSELSNVNIMTLERDIPITSLPKPFQQLLEEKRRSYIRIGVAISGYHRRAVMVNNFNSGTLYLTSLLEVE